MPGRKLYWTVFWLALGYAGYYLCRSNFSIAKPLLLEAFPDLDKAKLGLLASAGTLLYAVGKMVHGPMADRFGGKRLFTYGMLGAIAFTLLFGLGGPPLFMLAWAGNRFVQSAGWGGMVRIVANWSPARVYGAVMALISLSYLAGDFLSRLLLGYWVSNGATWQDLYTNSAIGLALIAIPALLLLRERPSEEIKHESATAKSDGRLFKTSFVAICVLSFVFTLLRETFNEWTPTYLNEYAKMSKGNAGQASSLFPLFGAISVIAVGIYSDRVAHLANPLQRLSIVPLGLAVGGVFMGVLALDPGLSSVMLTAVVSAIAFALIGPYSLLAGATSLDFGKSTNPATAAGWIDGIGYIGGILSGYGVGQIAQSLGWKPAFGVLSIFTLLSAVGLALMLRKDKQQFARSIDQSVRA